jgi:predicted nucleic acid-binding protein
VRAYFDANVIIYAAEGDGDEAIVARRLFALADEGRLNAVTSELTIAEATAPSRRSGTATVAQRLKIYTDLLINSPAFQLIEIDMDILLRTPWLRNEQAGLRLVDAIHLATALESGCQIMITNDRRIRSTPELGVVAPTKGDVDGLVSRLS